MNYMSRCQIGQNISIKTLATNVSSQFGLFGSWLAVSNDSNSIQVHGMGGNKPVEIWDVFTL